MAAGRRRAEPRTIGQKTRASLMYIGEGKPEGDIIRHFKNEISEGGSTASARIHIKRMVEGGYIQPIEGGGYRADPKILERVRELEGADVKRLGLPNAEKDPDFQNSIKQVDWKKLAVGSGAYTKSGYYQQNVLAKVLPHIRKQAAEILKTMIRVEGLPVTPRTALESIRLNTERSSEDMPHNPSMEYMKFSEEHVKQIVEEDPELEMKNGVITMKGVGWDLNHPRIRMAKHITENPGTSLTGISRAGGCSKSTASHLLRTLESKGLVNKERAGKAIRIYPAENISPELLIAESRPTENLVHKYVDWLKQEYGETDKKTIEAWLLRRFSLSTVREAFS
ncbi:MAG: helix-turn-helix domain-containing protein [Candidatus Diapherotrites archaeon]|nr:helix-turn-helix domain-containing protein [Candidatus Diapherotrites archaeon]